MLRTATLAVALAVATVLAMPEADAQSDDKCSPAKLSQALHERMGKDGKSDAEIRDILDSSFKRRVLRGRVADGSGCTADQAENALQSLETLVKPR